MLLNKREMLIGNIINFLTFKMTAHIHLFDQIEKCIIK
jgi:hypothetical protein